MFNFICKSFPRLRNSIRALPTHRLHFFQLNNHLSSAPSKRTLKEIISKNAKDGSFTVNYLIKRCGFAPEKAISASKYVNFNKPDKPDAVIACLKNQGLSEPQVLKLIRTFPPVVLCDPEKTLLPKIEFFMFYGVSKADLPAMLVRVPGLFRLSLDRNIIPSFYWLDKYLGSSENAMVSIARCPRLLSNFQNYVVCNIEVLRQVGVPKAGIRNLLTHWAPSLAISTDKFKEIVEEVRKLGFDPVKSAFVTAVHVKTGLSRSSWEKKIEVYKKWGCSEDEVLAAFMMCPWCMSVSEDKIEGIMGFLVNEMGWSPSMLLQRSHLLSLSLNRRIIPRCSVYRVLVSKGFIKQLPGLFSWLVYSEVNFRKRLECFEKEAPEIFKLYQEKAKLLK